MNREKTGVRSSRIKVELEEKGLKFQRNSRVTTVSYHIQSTVLGYNCNSIGLRRTGYDKYLGLCVGNIV